MNFFNLRFILLICCFYGYSVESLAQFKNYNTENRFWNEGVVYLSSGEVVEGLVNYNFVVDLLKVDNGNVVKSYIPNNVYAFILKDSANNLHEFVSLSYDIEEKGRKVPTFFYKIYQNTHYAILSKHVIDYRRSDPMLDYTNVVNISVISEKVTHLIFIADRTGMIQQCLEKKKATNMSLDFYTVVNPMSPSNKGANATEYRDHDMQESVRAKDVKRFKISDKNAFRTFFGRYYRGFSKFVEQNAIDLRYLDELRRAIDFRENR